MAAWRLHNHVHLCARVRLRTHTQTHVHSAHTRIFTRTRTRTRACATLCLPHTTAAAPAAPLALRTPVCFTGDPLAGARHARARVHARACTSAHTCAHESSAPWGADCDQSRGRRRPAAISCVRAALLIQDILPWLVGLRGCRARRGLLWPPAPKGHAFRFALIDQRTCKPEGGSSWGASIRWGPGLAELGAALLSGARSTRITGRKQGPLQLQGQAGWAACCVKRRVCRCGQGY